jgi:hypothetical protein
MSLVPPAAPTPACSAEAARTATLAPACSSSPPRLLSTRFVIDHASCPVLLVWPETPPAIATIPAPPA